MKTRAVIFDIDGTIANNKHREHLAEAKKWDEFFAGMGEDTLHRPIVTLMEWYDDRGYDIILLTGRSEEYRAKTHKWFSEMDSHAGYSMLLMRASKDFRKDYVIKEEIYRREIEPHYEIEAVYEDRSSVVKMWRELGLTCLQVANGNF